MQSVTQNVMADPLHPRRVQRRFGGGRTCLCNRWFVSTSTTAISAFAFGGSMLSLLLVYSVGMIGNTGSGNRLVLAGMAVSVILTAATQFFHLYSSRYLHGTQYHFMDDGQPYQRTLETISPFLLLDRLSDRVSSCSCHGHITCFRRETRQPPAWAWMYGRVKRTTIIVVSFVTGVVVAAGGVIGFIGFIVPHIIRILVGADHRRVFPLSFIGGSLFLLWMDVLARTIMGSTGTGRGHLYRFLRRPLLRLAALPQEQIRQDVRWITMEHKIEIRDLHYRVPTREILHDVSLQVDKNQFVGLIGPQRQRQNYAAQTHLPRPAPRRRTPCSSTAGRLRPFPIARQPGR